MSRDVDNKVKKRTAQNENKNIFSWNPVAVILTVS